jgi:hypothetical protein
MVAVSAIAGMLWAAGGAAACETRAVEKATRACCLAAATPDCRCCDAGPTDSPPPPPQAEEATSTSPSAATFGSQAESCECRVEEPAQPSDKRSERPAEERPERERAESILVLPRVESPRASAFGSYSGPVGVPAKTPLYLRTSRFLI